MKGWFTENISLKVIALLLALVLHLFLRGDREEVQGVFLPVSVTIPNNRVLMSDPINRIKLTVRGKRSSLDRLDEEGLQPLRVDLADVEDGTFEFSPDLFRMPPGITVTSVKPPSMRMATDVKDSRDVQVVPRAKGEVAPGYRVIGRSVEPPEVTVAGPRGELKDMTAVITDPIDVSGRTQSFTTTTTLPGSGRGHTTFDPEKVEVTIDIEPILVQRTFTAVPVELRSSSEFETEVEPTSVDVTLNGPKVMLNEMEPTDIVAIVQGFNDKARPPASDRRPVDLEGLAKDVNALRIEPESVTIRLKPAEAPAPEEP